MTDYDELEKQIAQLRAQQWSSADPEQERFLLDHGKCQEDREKSFCWGMLAGGAIALTVYTVTLVLVGVIK